MPFFHESLEATLALIERGKGKKGGERKQAAALAIMAIRDHLIRFEQDEKTDEEAFVKLASAGNHYLSKLMKAEQALKGARFEEADAFVREAIGDGEKIIELAKAIMDFAKKTKKDAA